jgi:hypothetical protein
METMILGIVIALCGMLGTYVYHRLESTNIPREELQKINEAQKNLDTDPIL